MGKTKTIQDHEIMSNKKAGTSFEHDFCVLAHNKGFWAHMLTANKHGQPSDVIISKNNISALVDCKECANGIFKLSRIEENQELAMREWIKLGNELAVFALGISNEVLILDYIALMRWKLTGIKQLNRDEILKHSKSFDEWEALYFANNTQ